MLTRTDLPEALIDSPWYDASDLYDGPPDYDGPIDLPDNSPLMSAAITAFAVPVQRTTGQALDYYARHADSWPFTPDGMCLAICRDARNIPARYPSAKAAQDATPREYRITRIRDIRPGMVVFYDDPRDSNRFGHVVTVAGRDPSKSPDDLASLVVWTNSVVRGRVVKVAGDYFPRHWGDPFVFAATWLNGQELRLEEVAPPKPTGLRVDFVDISHHQKAMKIDWDAAAKAGVGLVVHKATEGSTVVDQWYAKRRAEAKAAGKRWGAYHFARPDKDGQDAIAEARWFVKHAAPEPGDVLALDLETRENLSGMPLVRWADEWCAEVERLTGIPFLMVYTPYVLSTALQARSIMWRPRYSSANTPPVHAWDAWQFSDGVLGNPNRVAGFPGPVDLNTLRPGLTLADLPTVPAPAPKPDPKPKPEGIRMRLALYPGQHSDSADQQADDIRRVLTRARNRGVLGVMITEAGHSRTNNLPGILRAAGAEHGWHVTNPPGQDCAILLDVEQVEAIGPMLWREAVAKNAAGRRHAARGALAQTFVPKDRRLGPEVSLIATHLLTGGRKPGDPSWALNQAITAEVGRAARELGRGHRIAFVGGDFNSPLDKRDPLAGQPITLAPIALGHHPATGPGGQPIDAIGSYDGDGRVKPVAWHVIAGAFPVPDAKGHKTPLSTDHAGWCEATYRIRAHG